MAKRNPPQGRKESFNLDASVYLTSMLGISEEIMFTLAQRSLRHRILKPSDEAIDASDFLIMDYM